MNGFFVTKVPEWHFDIESGKKKLLKQLGAATLAGYGCEDMTLAIGACGALLDYAAKTQGQALAHVTAVSAERAGEYVRPRRRAATSSSPRRCAASRRRRCFRCSTSARRAWAAGCSALAAPPVARPASRGEAARCRRSAERHKRPEGAEALLGRRAHHCPPRAEERAAARACRAAGQPQAAARAPPGAARRNAPPQGADRRPGHRPKKRFILEHAIHPEPSARVIDGGVIADGYSADLDELRQLQAHSGEFLVSFEAKEKQRPVFRTCAWPITTCTATTSR